MANRKRILIIGGSGFVGSNLSRSLSKNHDVIATFHREYSPIPGVGYRLLSGLGDKDICQRFVQKLEPEVIIYAAGTNDLTRNEKDPAAMIVSHTNGANNMMMAGDFVKAKYILISNDNIFSGMEGNYSEGDTAIPLNALGKAKLGAENFVRSRSLNHVIIRSSLLLGRGTIDHPSWLDELRETEITGKKLTLSRNRIHNPVHIRELETLVEKVIENDIRNKTLHIGGLTKISEYDLAKRFMNAFDFDESDIHALETIYEYPYQDFSLNFSQTLRLLKTEPLLLQQSLDLLK